MRPQVSTEESEIMNIPGKKQIKVTETRDEYPSVPYHCCKQLKLPDEEKLIKLQVTYETRHKCHMSS